MKRALATAAGVVLLACSVGAADAIAARSIRKQQPWGAIAYDTRTGAYGYAVDVKTKRDAEAEAFRQCGSGCDTIKTFKNTCGAIAAKPKHVYWDTGASREIAETKVLKKCGGAECKIAVWACTSEK